MWFLLIEWEARVMDLLYLGVTLAFFAVTAALVWLCGTVGEQR